MSDQEESRPPYIHLQPPRELDGGGIQIRVRTSDYRIITLTIPRRQSTVTGIHEAVMGAIRSQPNRPAAP